MDWSKVRSIKPKEIMITAKAIDSNKMRPLSNLCELYLKILEYIRTMYPVIIGIKNKLYGNFTIFYLLLYYRRVF